MAGSSFKGTRESQTPARRGLATLGQSVNLVTSPALRRRGFAEAAIVTRWDEIVGRPLSDHCRPFRVVFPRGQRLDGTLHLTVTGAFAPEVQHLAPQIVERINTYFGYGAVKRLELHHGRVDAKPRRKAGEDAGGKATEPDGALAAAIAKVDDEDLRAALARLAVNRSQSRSKGQR